MFTEVQRVGCQQLQQRHKPLNVQVGGDRVVKGWQEDVIQDGGYGDYVDGYGDCCDDADLLLPNDYLWGMEVRN